MNFLAHALLASSSDARDAGLIAGGMAGDWIKGPLAGSVLPADFLRGVALHRAIDSFADHHPAFQASRARCAPAHRRWSGVFVDIYYDHLLAVHWSVWHAQPLREFVNGAYLALDGYVAVCPPSAHMALTLMKSEDWLSSYATRAGIADVLARMGRRARQPNPLAEGMADLLAQEDDFLTDFGVFLHDAVAFSAHWQTEHPF